MVNTELIEWKQPQFNFYRKLGNYVQFFQTDMPVNNEHVPMKYIDPTVLAQATEYAEKTDDITEDTLAVAIVDIDFSEGFPTISGIPFWERLDGEAINFYTAFKQYRLMKEISGVRSIARLSEDLHVSGKYLNALAKVFHWQARCVAYDQYRAKLKAWEKESAIENLESEHSKVANKLLTSSMDYLEKHPEQLNPKIAIQMVQLAIKTGRVAAGLPADKPVGCESSGGRGGTNIQINNSPSAEANIAQPSMVEAVDEKVKEPEYLQSILHILDKSGAFEAEAAEAAQDKVVEAEYSDA